MALRAVQVEANNKRVDELMQSGKLSIRPEYIVEVRGLSPWLPWLLDGVVLCSCSHLTTFYVAWRCRTEC